MDATPATHIYCPQCGYDLFGIPELRCPECGFGYDHKAIRRFCRRVSHERLRSDQDIMLCAWLATALILSPLTDRVGVGCLEQLFLVGAALAAVLLAGKPPRDGWVCEWRLVVLRAVLGTPVFVAVVSLVLAFPHYARIVATAVAALGAVELWAAPRRLPYAARDLGPRLRQRVRMNEAFAVWSLASCWLLVVLSWLLG